MSKVTHFPMQPVMTDRDGTRRFVENRIIRDLVEFSATHGRGIHAIAAGDYTDQERQQFAQLNGYSIRGYGELSYVDDVAYEQACAQSDGDDPDQVRLDLLDEVIQDALKAHIAMGKALQVATTKTLVPEDLDEDLNE